MTTHHTAHTNARFTNVGNRCVSRSVVIVVCGICVLHRRLRLASCVALSVVAVVVVVVAVLSLLSLSLLLCLCRNVDISTNDTVQGVTSSAAHRHTATNGCTSSTRVHHDSHRS